LPDTTPDAASAAGPIDWAASIAAGEWRVYQQVIDEARAANIEFAVGGAFAVAAYTGHWRNTKDLDLYVLPERRQAMIAALTRAGLRDYYDHEAYDRGWIYRAVANDVIVDVIWAMANRRAEVDEEWVVDRAREHTGTVVQLVLALLEQCRVVRHGSRPDIRRHRK
jgi:hypothetical protein